MLSLPQPVNTIITTLETHGFAAYAVGGCVRDLYMGKTPNDYDICTAAMPDKIKEIFKNDRLVLTGEKHGTVTLLKDGSTYEITSFRSDGAYSDARRPDKVCFGVSIENDLARRDFTVNAMAFSEMRGTVDIFGSRADIASKTLRCVGNPEARFSEDALRILRLARFCAQLGFTPENETLSAAKKLATLLKNVSNERICAELSRLLLSEFSADAMIICADIFKAIFGSFDTEKWQKSAEYINNSPQQLSIRLALLSTAVGTDFLHTFRFDKATSQTAALISKALFTPLADDEISVLHALNKYGKKNLSLIIAAKSAAGIDIKSVKTQVDNQLSQNACFSLKQLSVNGNDALAAGIKGEKIGEALSILLEKVITSKIKNDRTILLNLLRDMV